MIRRRALGSIVAVVLGGSAAACNASEVANAPGAGPDGSVTSEEGGDDSAAASSSDSARGEGSDASGDVAADAPGNGSSDASDAGSDGSTSPADAGGGAERCDSGPGGLTAIWSLPSVTPAAIAVDPSGNTFVAGSFSNTVTFGTTPSLVSAGGVDMFLAKLDPSGNVLWANRYGNTFYDDPSPAIAVDASGNVFFVGFFNGTLPFGGGTTPLAAIGEDAFVVKISASGTTTWADRFGYDEGPYAPYAVAVAPDGNPVVAGTAQGTVVFGSKTWTETTAAAQPFALELLSSNGTVLWSADGEGSLDTDHISVAVDATGRTFVVGRVLSGAGTWGAVPASAGVNFVAFRVGLDASGAALWSQFDVGSFPMGAAVDADGRLSVVENATGASPYLGADTIAQLSSPIDGTVLSEVLVGPGANTFPWALTTDTEGNTLIAGQYADTLSFGSSSYTSGGGAAETFFVGALDGLSRPEAAQSLGTSSDGVQPYGLAVTPSGKILALATSGASFATSAGTVPAAAFVAVYAADSCDLDAGPLGPSTGDASNHGDLPLDGSAYLPSDASPASCPSTQPEAVNGAACPVAIGCDYSGTCCFCAPTSCGAQSTTWTCDPIGAQPAGCPSSPPNPGTSCPSGAQCNYCLPGGRFFANCNAGGWETGYAQVVCD